MERKPLRVLSLDWDYFIGATMEQRNSMFPDGGTEDRPESLKNIVWACHYGDPRYAEELRNIPVYEEGLKTVQRIVEKAVDQYTTAAYAFDSHKPIFDVIIDTYSSGQYSGLVVHNFDFHHDYYGLHINFDQGNDVHCGNWVNALFDYDSPYTPLKGADNREYVWIKRKDSDVDMLLRENSWYKECESIEVSEPYDIVYICRSGVWSPPHLDGDFNMLLYDVSKLCNFCSFEFSGKVFQPRRDTEQFWEIANSMKQQNQKLLKDMNERRKKQ